MKKTIKLKPLLLSLTFSPIMALVACSKYSKDDANGYNLAMQLPGIRFANLGDDDSQDKYQEISIKLLMERLRQNPEIRNQYFGQITKRLALSVLKTAHKDGDGDQMFKKLYNNSLDSINLYFNKTLKEKQWGTNWKNELAKKVKEFGSEENFKESLLLDENVPGNIMSLLKQEIIDKYQVDYLFYSLEDIKVFIKIFLDASKKSGFDIDKWYNNNEEETKKVNNALLEAYPEIKNKSELKAKLEVTSKNVAAKTAYHRDKNGNPIESDYPITGLVSKEQKYFVETWYNNEKPLYLSEISFKYDADNHNGLDNGISWDKNFSVTAGKNQQNITNFITDLKNNKTFDILANQYSDGEEKSNYGEIKELLTLTSTNTKFNPIMKSAVYSLALGLTNKIDHSTIDAKKLIEQLNQDRNESADRGVNADKGKIQFSHIKFNNRDDQSAVVFADKDSIRFVRINGQAQLNKGFKADENNDDTPDNNKLNPNIIDSENRRLSKTPYLKYLFDNYKRLSPTGKRGIDVLDQVKKYTDNSNEKIQSNSGWWFWFWNYMSEKTSDNDWYKKYIANFNSLDNNWKEIIEKQHKSLFSSLAPGNFNTFTESLSKENAEIITNLKSKNASESVKAEINIKKIRTKFFDSTQTKWKIGG